MPKISKKLRNILIFSCFVVIVFLSLVIALYQNLKFHEIAIIKNSGKAFKDSVFLTPIGKFSIVLDSLTTPEAIGYFQVINERGKEMLSFLNTSTNNIYIYDFKTKLLSRQIDLNKYGFKSEDKVQGYFMLNRDSIFVYSYTKANLCLLSLIKGKILSKSIVNQTMEPITSVFPYISPRTPMLYNSKLKKLFMSGFFSDEGGVYDSDKKKNVLAIFDFKTGGTSFCIHYPDFYWGYNWGGAGGYRQSFITLDTYGNILVSFMANHNIAIYDSSGKYLNSFYCGSKYIQEIKSMNYTMNYFDFIDQYDIYKYYIQNPSYSSIIFDNYNQLYYRVAEFKNNAALDSTPKKWFKEKSLVVLNRDFKVVGETLLQGKNKIDCNNYFLSRKGIWFKTLEYDENRISFVQFKPTTSIKNATDL